MQNERFIAHVDMDAFFAAVEQRDNPRLIGKPVIIGADPKDGRGRGVVSTCSYQARIFGIRSAMPISIAYRLCPSACFLPPDMPKYARVSRQIYGILENFTPCIEPAGIDEAFLDITGSSHLFGSPRDTCVRVKERIKSETKLIASVGLAPTRMAAKIASDMSKPDGFLQVQREELLDFLWPLPVDRIWGLGKKTKEALNSYGIITIGDLAHRNRNELRVMLGVNGEYFWNLAHGRDERRLCGQAEAKSISNETTFEHDTNNSEHIKAALLSLCEKVSGRLRAEGLKARTITLKIRLEGFQTHTRTLTLQKATNFSDTIYRDIKKLYESFSSHKKVRLVGVKVSGLLPVDIQDSIFVGPDDLKKESVHKAIDAIKEKFGDAMIHRAGSGFMRSQAFG
ncbi:MAG: DNA polymerase IV [Candidatus Omnitrophota bacterium]|nr:DNA polymerase IV [Candidatus Omnitrophota bacterium]